jgi:GrpB-like predicted nucleotidyltransferase (UPF0157 family)
MKMPAPIEVELWPHSVDWKLAASDALLQILQAAEDFVLAVHHIGSTAIPGIHAKPIIDLLPIVRSVVGLDDRQALFLQLGYQYWGEYGIPGRRYCTWDDPSSGRRKFQLHCFESEHCEIERHLAFRDYLRANQQKAQEYDEEKRRCRKLHLHDSHAYSAAKANWIAGELPAALTYFRSSG